MVDNHNAQSPYSFVYSHGMYVVSVIAKYVYLKCVTYFCNCMEMKHQHYSYTPRGCYTRLHVAYVYFYIIAIY